MQHPDIALLLETLKKVMKSKKLIYRDIANGLGVSENTVKRIFSGQPCNLVKIIDICALCEISFFDLTSLAHKIEEENFFLSAKHEEHFSKYPGQYYILRELSRGQPVPYIRNCLKMSKERFYKVLRVLESLELIEVLPNENIKLNFRGTLRIDEEGPLAKVLLLPQNLDFLDHVQKNVRKKTVCFQSIETMLSKSQINSMVQEIHALGKKYRLEAQKSIKTSRRESLTSIRWLFAFAPYQTDWSTYKVE